MLRSGLGQLERRLGRVGCSFTLDTTVATPSGPVPISELRVGDVVLAYDPETGETGPHTVTAIMVNLDPATEELRLSTGSIQTTPDHPFFTADRGWVEAGALRVGELIRTLSGGYATVLGYTISDTPATMWDITVDGAHSFFVGSGSALVHNCPADLRTRWPRFNTPPGPAPKFAPPRPMEFINSADSEYAQGVRQIAQETGDIGNISKSIGSTTPPPGATRGGIPGAVWRVVRFFGLFGGGS